MTPLVLALGRGGGGVIKHMKLKLQIKPDKLRHIMSESLSECLSFRDCQVYIRSVGHNISGLT